MKSRKYFPLKDRVINTPEWDFQSNYQLCRRALEIAEKDIEEKDTALKGQNGQADYLQGVIDEKDKEITELKEKYKKRILK